MANRLQYETSPYLRQHADNPVDWFPWGDEALTLARESDRPILLSIGYSACHWCHVMERESFEDEATAATMNENFVNIKVDREERPDLDAIYMDAVQAMTGHGGWPLTVFCTPQGRPFYGGTYFPPQPGHGLPSFSQVLQAVARSYRERRKDIEAQAEQVVSHLEQALTPQHSADLLTAGTLAAAYASLRDTFDHEHGGFGSAPKFPQPMALEFLLRYHHRSGDPDALHMVEHTLQAMARGGLFDHLGGGFHRYSVDQKWLVPHFEKMLYDNALLARIYLHAYQATGNALYRHTAEKTLDYMLREMKGLHGGLYTSQDADSEDAEGTYYIWSADELADVVGREDAGLIGRYFGISQQGNFDGANVLSRAIDIAQLAAEAGLTIEAAEARVAAATSRLMERRSGRTPPGRDEKVVAGWNGLALAALAEAAAVLDRADYLEAARANASFLADALLDGEYLQHSYTDGHASGRGFLQDYALVAEGLLALYEATFEERWLRTAIDLAAAILALFWDGTQGTFHDTTGHHERLVLRPRNILDNALPSGPAAAAFTLLRVGRLTGGGDHERAAAAALRSAQGLMARYPLGLGHWLSALDLYLSPPLEIAVVGSPRDAKTRELLDVLYRHYLPHKALAGRDPAGQEVGLDIPLLQDRGQIGDRPTAYVCGHLACLSPATDADALAALLQGEMSQ